MILGFYLSIWVLSIGTLSFILISALGKTSADASVSMAVFRKLRTRQKHQDVSKDLENAFVFISPEKLAQQRQMWAIGLGSFGLIMGFFANPLAGVPLAFVLGVVGYIVPLFLVKRTIAVRKIRLHAQVLDMMDTIGNGLKAGLSFPQALETAATQLPDPMGQELRLVLREIQLGESLDDALVSFAERSSSESLKLVISAVTVTRQLGGNLPDIFQTIGQTIRDKEKMDGKVNALTSQGKMQGIIMGAIPFALMGVVYLVDAKTMMPLFTTPIGLFLLVMVFVLDGLGFLFIRRIVDIDSKL